MKVPRFNTVLNLITAVLVGYLLVTLVHVQTNNAKALAGIRRIQIDQQRLLKNQVTSVESLKADNEKKLDILICLVLVPQDQRTLDTAKDCRKQASGDSSAGGTPVGTTVNTSDNSQAVLPSPQPAPQPTISQPTTSQPSDTPQPAPKPNLIQQVINNVKGLL